MYINVYIYMGVSPMYKLTHLYIGVVGQEQEILSPPRRAASTGSITRWDILLYKYIYAYISIDFYGFDVRGKR